ncbi:MAG TPA: Uma2 family endonuclease [Thermoanaerobaculia bacterium]|nr:Uma2 family endonuclease [Thermoanaerobaculia bacterium]
MAAIPLQHEVYYPERDGQPMGETGIHGKEIRELTMALELRYRDAPDVYVGSDMLMYYVQGDPTQFVCPDVFVTFGIPKEPLRRSYFFWKEGVPPTLVIEVTSDRRNDLEKRKLYARLGVREYFIDDPLGEYLNPPLQGLRLVKGEYRPIELAADGSLLSEVTGLRFRREGRWVRLIDAATGERLLWSDERDQALEERDQALEEKDQALQAERAARLAAEEEIARLRRELERRG